MHMLLFLCRPALPRSHAHLVIAWLDDSGPHFSHVSPCRDTMSHCGADALRYSMDSDVSAVRELRPAPVVLTPRWLVDAVQQCTDRPIARPEQIVDMGDR